MARHRADVRDVLIDLFERPIPESDLGREIMTRVMGRPVDFREAIIHTSRQSVFLKVMKYLHREFYQLKTFFSLK